MALAPAARESAPSAKPRFLGLLNELAEGERRGYEHLTAWADRCTDPEVEKALRMVAARELEHSATFARRVVELGYRVRPRPDNDRERRVNEVLASGLDDRATFEALGYATDRDDSAEDVFDGLFRDHSIDPHTGGLLGRYIAEERDSDRLLRATYRSLVERAGVPG